MLTSRFRHAALEWVKRLEVGCWDALKALAQQVRDDISHAGNLALGKGVPDLRAARAFVHGKNATLTSYAMEYVCGSQRIEGQKLVAVGVRVALLIAIVECGLDRRGDVPGDLRAQCEHMFGNVDADITTPYETLRNFIQKFLEKPQGEGVAASEIGRFYSAVELAVTGIQNADPNLIGLLLSA